MPAGPPCAAMCRDPAIGFWRPSDLPTADWLSSIGALSRKGGKIPVTRSGDQVTGIVDMVGVMRWPQPRGAFSPNDEPERNLWFVRDPVAIASAKGWGEVAPFFVEIGKSAAAQRPSARRHAQRELAQRTSAIRDHMVRTRRGGRCDVRVLASQP